MSSLCEYVFVMRPRSKRLRLVFGRSILQELAYVKKKQGRGTVTRYFGAEEDADEVLACYSRINKHLRRLSVSRLMLPPGRAIFIVIQLESQLSILKAVNERETVSLTPGI